MEKAIGTQTEQGVVLTPTETEEYCIFKKQKRISEVQASLSKSETDATVELFSDLKKSTDVAKKLCSSALRTTPNLLTKARSLLVGSSVYLDCIVGGNGETATKVKAYEAKYAVKNGAKEISLRLSSVAFKNGRIADIKKEIKKVRKKARRAPLKVIADKDMDEAELVKLAKLCEASGAKYVVVPFYTGAERLRSEIGSKCMLEITDVETASDYKELVLSGVERIATKKGLEIYDELMKEAEDFTPTVVELPALKTPTVAEKCERPVEDGTPV